MHLRSSSFPFSTSLWLGVLSIFVVVTASVAAPAGALAQGVEEVAMARCEIVGTPGDDVLVGTGSDDVICGLGGDDTLIGGAGHDELIGGSGNDHLIGGAGNDELRGNDGTDELSGGPGDDELRGGHGADFLIGGPGNDELRGGNDGDEIAGGVGDDVLRGGNGNDNQRGAGGNDTLWGGPGDDILRGGSGNDRLLAGPAADVCIDSFAKTFGSGCEFGRNGNGNPLAVGRQLWSVLGNNEFAYELAVNDVCEGDNCLIGFGDTVHVRDDVATAFVGEDAFTAAELFDMAEEASNFGRIVEIDRSTGLPTRLERADGSILAVTSVDLRDALRASYDEAVAAWQAAAIADYSFTYVNSCFCAFVGEVRVTVRGGTVVSSEGLAMTPDGFVAVGQTIDEHLARLGEALDGTSIRVDAEFDDIGIPTSVYVDVASIIADEELGTTISDFVDESADAIAEPLPAAAEPAPALAALTLVEVDGIEVSQEIEGQVKALLAAADADGLSLSGGGFRDPARQIELRKANCGTSDYEIFEMPASQCNPPTAKPGRSQHEIGLAIDFTNDGLLVTSRDDPAFVWLAANAGTYGFINLPSEPWHWSTTGN